MSTPRALRSRRPPRTANVFRSEAIEHHRAADDAVVLPHYATLSVRLSVWALILLLLLAAGFAFTASVPRYLSGHATVVETTSGVVVEVALPQAATTQLHAGEGLTLVLDGSTQTVATHVAEVRAPGPPSSTVGAGTPVANPVTVVAPLPVGVALPASSTGEGAVEVGRQPFISWVLS